jgi:hypothetical protein
MYTLDKRFEMYVQDLAKKEGIIYSEELKETLTAGISLGQLKSNTWENATNLINERFQKLIQTEQEVA